MKKTWDIIYVNDIEKSVEFYEKVLGLKVKDRLNMGSEMQIAFMELDSELCIELIYSGKKEVSKESVILVFTTDNLDNTIQDLKDKNINPGEIISPNPNTQFIHVEDPDGVIIQIQE